MHPAAASIKYFGVYVIVTGLGLMLMPALVLAPLGIPAPTEVWIRVVGALATVVGYYYWACGTANAVAFFRATVGGRIAFGASAGKHQKQQQCSEPGVSGHGNVSAE